jgi:hypothetical protein
MLLEKLAKVVTVLTTNYDLGLDLALAAETGGALSPLPGTDSKDAPPTFTASLDGGRLQYIKIHGCITKRESLVFTMERLAELTFQPERLRKLISQAIAHPRSCSSFRSATVLATLT